MHGWVLWLWRRDRQAVRKIKDERTAFLAQMSHDLRSPLHVILGYSDELLETTATILSPEQRRQLIQIRESAQQLYQRITQLPNFRSAGDDD
jgi:signal transduction histidine kinase